MLVVRYRHESDENHFLTKLKHMKRYVEDVIDCVENKDGEYEEYDDEDYEDEDFETSRHSKNHYRGGSRMSRRSGRTGGRYDY